MCAEPAWRSTESSSEEGSESAEAEGARGPNQGQGRWNLLGRGRGLLGSNNNNKDDNAAPWSFGSSLRLI